MPSTDVLDAEAAPLIDVPIGTGVIHGSLCTVPKLRTFLALDSVERLASFEALAALAVAQALVRLVPPRRWRARFGAVAGNDQPDRIDAANLTTIRIVRLAIARAARNLPTDPNCLPQALAARRMLDRRGIRSSLFLGTSRSADAGPRFHAWLKVGGEWVTGMCDESRYALLVPADAGTA